MESVLDQTVAEPSIVKREENQEEKEKEEKEKEMTTRSSFKVPPMTLDPRKWALGSLLTTTPSWMLKGNKENGGTQTASKLEVVEPIPHKTGEETEAEETRPEDDSQGHDSDRSDSQATVRLKRSADLRPMSLDVQAEDAEALKRTADLCPTSLAVKEEDTEAAKHRLDVIGEIKAIPNSLAREQTRNRIEEDTSLDLQYMQVYLPEDVDGSEILEKRRVCYAKVVCLLVRMVITITKAPY